MAHFTLHGGILCCTLEGQVFTCTQYKCKLHIILLHTQWISKLLLRYSVLKWHLRARTMHFGDPCCVHVCSQMRCHTLPLRECTVEMSDRSCNNWHVIRFRILLIFATVQHLTRLPFLISSYVCINFRYIEIPFWMNFIWMFWVEVLVTNSPPAKLGVFLQLLHIMLHIHVLHSTQ